MKVENAMLPPLLQIAWKQGESRKRNHPHSVQIAWRQKIKSRMQSFLLCYRLARNKIKVENAIIPPAVQIWLENAIILFWYRLARNRMKVEDAILLFSYRLAGNRIKVENVMVPPLLQID